MKSNSKNCDRPRCLMVAGTAFEIGVCRGKAYESALQQKHAERHFAVYRNLIQPHDRGAEEALFQKMLDRAVPFKETFPDTFEELRGMAAGAAIPLPSLLAMNGFFDSSSLSCADKCTTLAFRDSDRGPMAGGAADTNPDIYVLIRKPVSGYANIQLANPFTLECCWGMNEKGLVVVSSGGLGVYAIPEELRTAEFRQKPSSLTREARENLASDPIGLGVKLVLEQCQDVDEAVRFLQQRKVRGCGSQNMVDAAGGICVVEKGFGWFGMREAVDGAAYTGNFFPAGLLSGKAYDCDMQQFFDDEDPIRQSWPGKFSRFRCMAEVAERNAGNYTLELLQNTLRGHKTIGFEDKTNDNGVCNDGTACAVIGIPKEKKMLISGRPPCLTEFTEYQL